MTNEQILDKLNKIKKLMDGTTGPEHEQIKAKYEELLKKYNSTEHVELGFDIKETVRINYNGYSERILTLFLLRFVLYEFKYTEGIDNNYIEVEMNDFEKKLFNFFNDYYKPKFEREIYKLAIAFISKNEIIPEQEMDINRNDIETVARMIFTSEMLINPYKDKRIEFSNDEHMQIIKMSDTMTKYDTPIFNKAD